VSTGASLAVAEAVASLKAEGCDGTTISGQFLNGAAVLLSRRCTEEEFVALARRMWRSAENQLRLATMLDRVLGGLPARAGRHEHPVAVRKGKKS